MGPIESDDDFGDNDLDYEADYEPPMKPCPVCGGSGRDQRESTVGDCPACQGEGTIENC